MTNTAITTFYKRLSDSGYTKPYLKTHVFPDWWEDDAANESGAFYELKLILSRRLGLDLNSLLDTSCPIQFKDTGTCHFKTTSQQEKSDKKNTQSLARALAEIASSAVRREYVGLPKSGVGVREEILSKQKPWVGFGELIDYLWSKGIPVLFVNNIHKRWKRMDGMVTLVKNRPVIILSKKTLSCAWQLFILAHEVGHIINGDLEGYTTYADAEVDKDDSDPIEQKANHTAIEILTSDGGTNFALESGMWLSADDLAYHCIHFGRELQIDPGHIALNYGYVQKQIATSNAALKIIEPESNVQALMARKLIENLDEDAIPEDSYLYLLKMCGPEK